MNRLEVDGIDLDLNENIAFPLSFSISDIKEPQKRKRNLSKSIKIVGTQKNLNFFASTYLLSLSDVDGSDVGFNFDPTQRVEARYYKNSILVFNGLMQLNEVVLSDKTYVFNCTLFSNFIDMFLKLGDLKVSELGWSEYDHALTRTIVENSFATSVIKNNVATVNFSSGNPLGFGYVYPLIDYGYNTVPTTFSIGNMIPLVYCREVVEKCLGISDIAFTSSFLDSILFKKLVLGFEGGKRLAFSPQEIASRQILFDGIFDIVQTLSGTFKYFSDTEFGYDYINTSTFNLLANPDFTEVVTSDPTTQYDATTGTITINTSGTYKFELSTPINQVVTPSFVGTARALSRKIKVVMKKNGSLVTELTFSSTSISDINQTFTFNQDVQCQSGDVITFILDLDNFLYYEEQGTIQIDTQNLTDTTVAINCINTSLNDGDTVELSTVIPDIKAVDFLSGIIKAFNLYVSDPDIDGVITIEPLNDYYQDTTVFDDWSNLVDYNKEFKIKPSSTIEGKNYLFEFSDESDYDNTIYKNEYNSQYGNKRYVVQSTFQTGDREYKLPFGQAVPVKLVNTDLVMPRIVKLNNNNSFEPYKGKPKLYFYNGLKTGKVRITNVAPGGVSNRTTYPSVHHFDNWENPTFDLNFELPKRIYYGNSNTIVTTDNIFSRYHEKFIKEITGRDSKIIECYVKLTNSQINTLDFSRLIMLNGVLFRLNEIKEFDSDVSPSTQVELIKIVEAENPRTRQIGTPSGVTGLVIQGGTGTTVISGGYKNVGIKENIKKG